MRFWRLTTARRIQDAFSGEGPFRNRMRWNHAGTRLSYTASHLSLAALEQLVRFTPALMRRPHFWYQGEVDDALVERVDVAALPPGWYTSPAPEALADMGDEWIASGRSVTLIVPSAVLRGVEDNVLLNPVHAAFGHVRATITGPSEFRFDERFAAWVQRQP